MAEGFFGGLEEVLSVDKRNGLLYGRLSSHPQPPQKQNPAGGLAADPTGRKYQ